MTAPSRTNQELIEENAFLKQRIQELESSESTRKWAKSERGAALEALRESEENYRLVVENAGEAIYIAQDGMLKFPNQAALDIVGYSKKN